MGSAGARAASAGGAATRSRPNDTSSGGSAADVTPSEATGAAVEPLRALQMTSAARLRAWRVAGDGDLAGRRGQRAALPVRSSSGRRSRAARRNQSPRSTGTGGPRTSCSRPVLSPSSRSRPSRYPLCMDLLFVSVVGVVASVLVALWVLGRTRARRDAVSGHALYRNKPQFQTTMNELREMREALRPSEDARSLSKRSS